MKQRRFQAGPPGRGGARTLTPQPSPLQQVLAQGLAAHQAGRLAEAEARYRRVLAADPSHADALHLLGLLALQCGQPGVAVDLISQAIRHQPNAAVYHSNLGVAHQRLEQHAEAADCYDRALTLDPNQIDALSNRGVSLRALGRLDDALQGYERALRLRSDQPDLLTGRGAALADLGRLDEAEASLRRVLGAHPSHAEALFTLGGVLKTQGVLPEALDCCTQAIAAAPNDPRAHDMLGTVLRAAGRVDEAIASHERALALYPNAAGGWQNLAGALQLAGRTQEAVAAYRHSLALNPDSPATHSSLIFALDLLHGASEERLAERRRWNERFGQAWRERPPAFANTRELERRLRVGYVSADFCNHSAATVFMPVLRAHDRTQVQVFCYSGTPVTDAVTAEAHALADRWHDTRFLSDDRLEAQIRADRIDVLVDLSGHTLGNRLPVFARKAAPVQVTAWGYATGTGLDAMNAFLADAVVVPPAEAARYAERIVHLPAVICFEPPAGLPEIAPLPALERGHITFGAFNRLPKITPETRTAWAAVLRAVPTARLLVKTGAQDSPAAVQQLADDLVALGVERDRLELRRPTPRLEHLAAHADIDLMLDSFPHTGGVTTVEALMMGVPVITLLGEGVAARLSASFLSALGLAELVATRSEQFVALAQAVAGRLPWLAEQRATLRDRLFASPIGDSRAYTRAVEAAYRDLWRSWCTKPSA
ncbi:MAG: tetratricopeptide repeat protein [Chloroflexi bacterium]|nr:tetratricopeptide repeat protein [Chloroflexota bacterium]